LHFAVRSFQIPLVSNPPDEIRLAITILLSAAVFIAAYRLARRATARDWIANSLDALLLTYAVQYAAVALPGLLSLLSPLSMGLTAIAISAGMWIAASRLQTDPDSATPRIRLSAAAMGLLFLVGYLGGVISVGRYSPVLGDDALTYHLPAAVQWLRTGTLGIYTTWFFNPANTYSPLGASTFMAWLIGPMNNDLLVRWVQAPALVLIYFAFIELCRAVGLGESIATLLSLAAVLSRPFISQSFEVKDDLFLAAFFLAAVAGCSRARLVDRLGAWRIGIALGLFFATKYTAILTAPLFILLIDAPLRAGWRTRRWIVAAGIALLLAAPWYLRNWIIAGNPLYPIPVASFFPGMFLAQRSTDMRTLHGIWMSLTDRFHSISGWLLVVLAAGWLCAVALSVKRLAVDPLIRMCTAGSLLGVLIFVFASHAAEIRYMYPALLLMFACCALAVERFPASQVLRRSAIIRLLSAAIIAAIAASGAFVASDLLIYFLICGALAALIAAPLALAGWTFLPRRRGAQAVIAIAGILGCSALIYVFWPGYVEQNRSDYGLVHARIHHETGELWDWVNQNLPPDATIAYTNTFMVHALGGFDFGRRLAYAPTRAGVHAYHDLPASRTLVSDQQIRGFVADLLTKDADPQVWRRNLQSIRPQFLLVGKQDVLPDPPERRFADSDPAHFQKLFENAAGTIYRTISQ
jgi:hypothetical protein